MLTLEWIDLRCPLCESVFESMAASSSDENGQYYIDPSAPASVAAAVLPYLVHVCRRCGYAGGHADFGEDVHVAQDVRERVISELAPQLGASVRIPWLALTVAGSDKFDGAARIAEWRGDDARRVAGRRVVHACGRGDRRPRRAARDPGSRSAAGAARREDRMTWWGVPPNAVQVRIASWNLAMSRDDAMQSTTDGRSANGDRSPMRCAPTTYLPTTDSVRMALALLFSLP